MNHESYTSGKTIAFLTKYATKIVDEVVLRLWTRDPDFELPDR